MNTFTAITVKTTFGASLALGLLLSPNTHATVYAAPVETVNLTDVQDIDSLPVCIEEDCSDQVGQTGVWFSKSTGDWYLERGEGYTRRIIDNTVVGGAYLGPDTVGSDPHDDHIATGPNAYDMGTYVGGWN